MPRRRTVRGVPADLATILRAVGALVFDEYHPATAFAVAAVVTGLVGGAVRRTFADAPNPQMKHGTVITAAGWFTTALFGALPFLFAAYLVPRT